METFWLAVLHILLLAACKMYIYCIYASVGGAPEAYGSRRRRVCVCVCVCVCLSFACISLQRLICLSRAFLCNG